MTVVQIHSSVSLPPKAICSAMSWLVSCTQALTLGPQMYPKNNWALSKGTLITAVLRLRPWYRFHVVRNSSTCSRSPLKILGSFPINLLFNWSGLGFGGAPPAASGSGGSPPPPPPSPFPGFGSDGGSVPFPFPTVWPPLRLPP